MSVIKQTWRTKVTVVACPGPTVQSCAIISLQQNLTNTPRKYQENSLVSARLFLFLF